MADRRATEIELDTMEGFASREKLHHHLNDQELDFNGHAVMSALIAPERSVKFHGSLVAQLLLKDENLPMNDFVSDWSSTLLTTVSQASKADDISLTRVALSAFLLSLERCPGAQRVVMEKGLHLMRETTKRTMNHKSVQESLAKGLESLCSGDMRLSLEEGQKWSCILLPWVFRETSSDAIRSSAITILSRICEDYGPSSIPISQGWLAIMLSDILKSIKLSLKGSAQPRDKVKTQIDQANVLSGTQSVNQLASAVVNLAVNGDSFALEDFLTLEPFINTYKNLKKGNIPKMNALDSALATLKGIKAMTVFSPRFLNFSSCFLFPRVFVNEDASGDIMVLQQQIQPLKEELAILKRNNISRSLAFGPKVIEEATQEHENDCTRHDNKILKVSSKQLLFILVFQLDTTKPTKPCCLMILPFWFSFTCNHSVSQLKSLETSLTGALRRDQMSEASIKQLEAEIEQLNRLVRQREDDNKCTKMMLKFREDKIYDQIQNEAAQDNKENNYVRLELHLVFTYNIPILNNMELSAQGYNRCLQQETAQCLTWVGHPETRFTFDHVACETIDQVPEMSNTEFCFYMNLILLIAMCYKKYEFVQETLFRMVGLPMVENCLSGYNSCIFAYGQVTLLYEGRSIQIRKVDPTLDMEADHEGDNYTHIIICAIYFIF
uniref:Uncharacterized protein n=1 Tax=Lactuca sativa TaxID=4236 RepID=A0A9R1XEX6_LACSA|nr:hypothetical protein LSAT_V11C400220470 [Lactuca sativa]